MRMVKLCGCLDKMIIICHGIQNHINLLTEKGQTLSVHHSICIAQHRTPSIFQCNKTIYAFTICHCNYSFIVEYMLLLFFASGDFCFIFLCFCFVQSNYRRQVNLYSYINALAWKQREENWWPMLGFSVFNITSDILNSLACLSVTRSLCSHSFLIVNLYHCMHLHRGIDANI